MSEWEVRDLKNGRGEKFGVGHYHPNFKNAHPFRVVSFKLSNGTIRRVWCDRDGRAMMVGWFFKGWNA